MFSHVLSGRNFSWSIVIAFAALGVVVALAQSALASHNHATDATGPLLVSAAEVRNSPIDVGEMARRSDVVVTGSVVTVIPGRVMDDAPGEPVVQVVDVLLEIDQTLSGEADSTLVAIEWMAWSEGGELDQPRREFVIDGLQVPKVGEQMVWFIAREEGSVNDVPRYGLVSLDGIFRVIDGKISSTIQSGDHGGLRLGDRASGLTIDELAAEIQK